MSSISGQKPEPVPSVYSRSTHVSLRCTECPVSLDRSRSPCPASIVDQLTYLSAVQSVQYLWTEAGAHTQRLQSIHSRISPLYRVSSISGQRPEPVPSVYSRSPLSISPLYRVSSISGQRPEPIPSVYSRPTHVSLRCTECPVSLDRGRSPYPASIANPLTYLSAVQSVQYLWTEAGARAQRL